MRILNLDKLLEGFPGITPVMGAFYLEAAMVSLIKKGFHSGAILKVYGDFEIDYEIKWSIQLEKSAINSWKDENQASTYGAVGIALLITNDLLGFNIFEEGQIGTGIDFWLSKGKLQEEEVSFYKKQARLEISGIGKETPGNTVNMRISKKTKQISASDDTELPGWIVVVEFSTPKSKIIKK